MRKVLQPSELMPPGDHGVLDSLRRRGTSRTLSAACPRRVRGAFAPGGSTRIRTESLPHPSSAQPTVDSGRRLARGASRSGDLRCSTFRRTCTVRETASMVRCGSLPAFPRKGKGCRTPCATKEAHGKRRPTHRHGLYLGPSGRGERGSDARGRARASLMLLQKSTDGVRRREADALHFTRSGSVQGRAPSSRPHVRKYVAAGEETPAPPPQRKPSRDRFRRWVRPAHGAGGWRWKASRIVWWASLHGASTKHGLGRLGGSHASRKRSGSHGLATGMSEARLVSGAHGRRRRVRTRDRPPKRIRRCEPPGPPVSVVQGASPGEGARRKPRRDTGNECGASARSRKQWEAEVGRKHRASCSAYCRKAGRRRARQPVANCSIRWRGGQQPISTTDGQRGAARPRAARREDLVAEVPG